MRVFNYLTNSWRVSFVVPHVKKWGGISPVQVPKVVAPIVVFDFAIIVHASITWCGIIAIESSDSRVWCTVLLFSI